MPSLADLWQRRRSQFGYKRWQIRRIRGGRPRGFRLICIYFQFVVWQFQGQKVKTLSCLLCCFVSYILFSLFDTILLAIDCLTCHNIIISRTRGRWIGVHVSETFAFCRGMRPWKWKWAKRRRYREKKIKYIYHFKHLSLEFFHILPNIWLDLLWLIYGI